MHDLELGDTTYEMEFEEDVDLGEFEGSEFEDEWELEYDLETEGGLPFTEAEEDALASELLEATTDEELEQFLGSLVKRAFRAVGRTVKKVTGRSLGGILKGIAKRALPIAGGALGAAFGGPAGGMVGRKIGSFASGLFELEMEGWSPEDQEFEVAKRVVRLCGAAAQRAAKAPPSLSPHRAVRAAITAAAKQHAPGLLRGEMTLSTRHPHRGRGRGGRWRLLRRDHRGMVIFLGR